MIERQLVELQRELAACPRSVLGGLQRLDLLLLGLLELRLDDIWTKRANERATQAAHTR